MTDFICFHNYFLLVRIIYFIYSNKSLASKSSFCCSFYLLLVMIRVFFNTLLNSVSLSPFMFFLRSVVRANSGNPFCWRICATNGKVVSEYRELKVLYIVNTYLVRDYIRSSLWGGFIEPKIIWVLLKQRSSWLMSGIRLVYSCKYCVFSFEIIASHL